MAEERNPAKEKTSQDGGHVEIDMLLPFTAPCEYEKKNPLILTESEGINVYDQEGNNYIDALSGVFCNALGGREPRLIAAATKQIEKLPFYMSFWNRTSEPTVELARDLVQMYTAVPIGRVFFANSGSECNDTQIKLAWFYQNARGLPNKKKIISRKGAYHGSTIAAASLTRLPMLHGGFDLPLPWVLHTDTPHYWKYAQPGETEEDFSERLAQNLEKLILKEDPNTIAALIGEPVMGAGGIIVPPEGYWEKVQKVLKKYDILLICDEVVTGNGRLGTMFASDLYGIKPDLVSLAKALSSAYVPIGAVLISEHVSKEIEDYSNKLGGFFHGFTYSGHPLACAVARECLKIYQERDVPAHVSRVAPTLQNGIRQYYDKHSFIGEVRGLGLALAVELVTDRDSKQAFPTKWGLGEYFCARTKARGMLVRHSNDIIMLAPQLIVAEAELEKIVRIFGEALEDLSGYIKQKKAEGK